jgi:hypothetical protein
MLQKNNGLQHKNNGPLLQAAAELAQADETQVQHCSYVQDTFRPRFKSAGV